MHLQGVERKYMLVSRGTPDQYPQQPEQAMTAARVAELGLGLTLEPEHITASAIRDAVTTVGGDGSYRSRVAHLQKAAREAGGYMRAADAIQQFDYEHSGGKKKE